MVYIEKCVYKTSYDWCLRFDTLCDKDLKQNATNTNTIGKCNHDFVINRTLRIGVEYICTKCGLIYMKFKRRGDNNANSNNEE